MRVNVKYLIDQLAKIWLSSFAFTKKQRYMTTVPLFILIYELKQFFLMRSEQIFVDRILDTVFDQNFRVVFQ